MRPLFVQKLSHKELTRHLFIPQTTVVRLKGRCHVVTAADCNRPSAVIRKCGLSGRFTLGGISIYDAPKAVRRR